MAKNHLLADLVTIIGTQDIVLVKWIVNFVFNDDESLEQFELIALLSLEIFNIDISINNATLYLQIRYVCPYLIFVY